MIRGLGSTHRAFLLREYFAILHLMNDIIPLEGFFVRHYALIEGDQVHLLDGGFIGGFNRIKRFLQSHDLDFKNIESLVISHGHLDHTFNISRLQEYSNCKIYAPLRDRELVEGHHQYKGLNKVGGFLEGLGSTLTNHQIPRVDHWFHNGERINIFGGLEVIALPGHTPGHCGFLHKERKLLVANDLFSSHFGRPKPPPRIFNDDHDQALASIIKASSLPIEHLLLNHGRQTSPEKTFQDLVNLANSLQ